MKRIIDNKGFTLVELMLVMAVMAVLLGIAIPNLFSVTAKSALKRAARDITVELKAARQLAISRNMQFRIVLIDGANDTVNRQFRINTGSPWQDDITRASSTLDARVRIQNGSTTITFNPNGSSINDCVCVENVSDSSDKMKIDIYSTTGRIEAGLGGC